MFRPASGQTFMTPGVKEEAIRFMGRVVLHIGLSVQFFYLHWQILTLLSSVCFVFRELQVLL